MPRGRPLTYQGETLSQTAWAARLGIDQTTLSHRLTHGWTTERALSAAGDARKRPQGCRWWPVHEVAWLEPIEGPGTWHPLPRSILAEALRWARCGGCASQIQVQEVACTHCQA